MHLVNTSKSSNSDVLTRTKGHRINYAVPQGSPNVYMKQIAGVSIELLLNHQAWPQRMQGALGDLPSAPSACALGALGAFGALGFQNPLHLSKNFTTWFRAPSHTCPVGAFFVGSRSTSADSQMSHISDTDGQSRHLHVFDPTSTAHML